MLKRKICSMAKASSPKTRRLAPLFIALGLLPVLSVAMQAAADDSDTDTGTEKSAQNAQDEAPENPWEAKKRILNSMASNPSVLINVTSAEMPSSPDILNLGRKGTAALQKGLADNVDDSVRRSCALMLGAIGDPSALPTLQNALEDWEPSVRYAVIQALGQIPDPSSFEPLLKLYRRKDEEQFNRLAILQAFGKIGSPKAVGVLRDELRRKPAQGESDLRPIALRSLWMSRHLMARDTLIGDIAVALRSDNDSLVIEAAVASADLRSPRLVQPLVPLMEHPNASIRNKSVYALGLIGDKTAAKALLARLPNVREARMLNNIAFALERLDRAAFYSSIRQVIEHKQAIIRLNAAFVLGDVKRPEGLELLKKALGDASDYVKTSAIVALGKIGAPAAAPLLEPFTNSPNLSIRQEAIYALHALSGGKKSDLIYQKLFQSKESSVKRRAGIELSKQNDPRMRSFVLSCVENQDCGLSDVEGFLRADKDPQVGGRLLLEWARGGEHLTDLIADLKPAGTLPLAMSSADAALARNDTYMALNSINLVGDMGDASAKARIASRIRETNTWLRVHTAVALARLSDKDADSAIFKELDNLAAEWMPQFVDVLRRIKESEVRARLTPELLKREKSSDKHMAMAAAAVRLAWDAENAFFRFLDALASQNTLEKSLAARYLKDNDQKEVTWVMRRALAREKRDDVRDRLRALLDMRPESTP